MFELFGRMQTTGITLINVDQQQAMSLTLFGVGVNWSSKRVALSSTEL